MENGEWEPIMSLSNIPEAVNQIIKTIGKRLEWAGHMVDIQW